MGWTCGTRVEVRHDFTQFWMETVGEEETVTGSCLESSQLCTWARNSVFPSLMELEDQVPCL